MSAWGKRSAPRFWQDQELAVMLIGLFLLFLAAFFAVVLSIQWLGSFLADASPNDSVSFLVALSALTSIFILARNGLGGIIVVVAVMVFWAFLLLGTDPATVITTLGIAAAVLSAAAGVVLSEPFLRQVSGK
jgi:uncharacterized membrane protein